MLVRTPRQISEVLEMNTLELDKDEYDYNAAKALIGARLDCPFGEALPLETPWDLTFNVNRSVEGNCHLLEGMAQINADQIGNQIISNSNLGTEEVFASASFTDWPRMIPTGNIATASRIPMSRH